VRAARELEDPSSATTRSSSPSGRIAEEYSYEWTVLRIMWDEDAGPRWGDEGLLGEDAQWMKRALGLSDALTDDLLTWKRDMTPLRVGRPPVNDWHAPKRRLDDRGDALAERLVDASVRSGAQLSTMPGLSAAMGRKKT
jgi:hypothetical protein